MTETKKRGRPKKRFVKFASLKRNEYCVLPNGGENVYVKVVDHNKKNKTNCIILQTGQPDCLPLDEVVMRVDRSEVKVAASKLQTKQTTPIQQGTKTSKLQTLQPDVFVEI